MLDGPWFTAADYALYTGAPEPWMKQSTEATLAAVLRQKAAAEATVRNPMQRLLVNRLGGFVGFADASSAEPLVPHRRNTINRRRLSQSRPRLRDE